MTVLAFVMVLIVVYPEGVETKNVVLTKEEKARCEVHAEMFGKGQGGDWGFKPGGTRFGKCMGIALRGVEV